LSEIVVNIPDDDVRLSDEDKRTILEELNIKKLEKIGSNVLDGMFEYDIHPVFAQLGPKFGEKANKVAQAIKSLNQKEIKQFVELKSLKKEIDGDFFEIAADDVEVKRSEQAGWAVTAQDELGVGVNTKMTEDLESEGLVRELTHKIQLMRKEADFDLTDRIRVLYRAEKKLKHAIESNIEYLKNETLAVEVIEGTKAGEISKTLDINGIEANVVLERV
jgi:isoleucyl-tRNA synthetase